MERHSNDSGWIEVITGSMFSGKSEELIRRLRRAQIARQRVQIFKPAIDNRYSEAHIVSHSEQRIESQMVGSAREILALVDISTGVVGIDEGQFFDHHLVAVANQLASDGKRVIIAGLDMDYLGKPFEPMPQLLAIAEDVTKTRAVCVVCGERPVDLHHLDYGKLGAEDYESMVPVCRRDHDRIHAAWEATPHMRRLGRRAASLAIIAEMSGRIVQ